MGQAPALPGRVEVTPLRSAPLVPLPDAQTTRNCRMVEGSGGVVLDAQTGQIYSLRSAPCVERGAHVGYDAGAAAAARAAVTELLAATLLRRRRGQRRGRIGTCPEPRRA